MLPLKTLSQLLKSKVAAVVPLVRSMRAAVAASSAQRLMPAPWCASTFLSDFQDSQILVSITTRVWQAGPQSLPARG